MNPRAEHPASLWVQQLRERGCQPPRPQGTQGLLPSSCCIWGLEEVYQHPYMPRRHPMPFPGPLVMEKAWQHPSQAACSF